MRAIPESRDHGLGVVVSQELIILVLFCKLQRDKGFFFLLFSLQRSAAARSGRLHRSKSSGLCFYIWIFFSVASTQERPRCEAES